jgi:ligand-binding sensor domain-containing protein
MYQDKEGILWIGTEGGGLNRFDPAIEKFLRWQHNLTDSSSISNNLIVDIIEDRKGILWIGTNEGLNSFDKKTERFRHFMKSERTASNYVESLIDDDGAISGYVMIAAFLGSKSLPQSSQITP